MPCSFFCLFVLHHPSPTAPYPFPYTTLFRSVVAAPRQNWPSSATYTPTFTSRLRLMASKRASFQKARVASAAPRIAADRKSTRLNSSHLVISYAVFCLKNKNMTTHAAAYDHT